MTARDEEVKPVCEIRQRQQNAARLVQEQREIFLSNLLIARHEKELGRIQYQREAKEAKLVALELESKEAQNRSKTSMTQFDILRNRYRLKLDEQSHKRHGLEGDVKRRQRTVQALEAEIRALEEKYTQYLAVERLLKDIESTYGKKTQTISDFLDFFERMENDGLFVVHNVESLRAKSEGTEGDQAAEERRMQREIKQCQAEINRLTGIKTALLKRVALPGPASTDALDARLNVLHKQITKIFRLCYPRSDATQNSVSMLTMLEADLEKMNAQLERIEPNFVAKKLKRLNLEKRAKQREAHLEKKKQDQQQKLNQMLERATRPVKKNDRRPLTPRVVPTRVTKTDTDRLLREQMERERIDQLLYGPVFDT
jgi:DNA repair exonuclease SbcCD ATPase subunit